MSQRITKLIPSMLDTALSGVLGGTNSIAISSGSFVLGSDIIAATPHTLFVNNLCATGNGGKIYGDGSSLTGADAGSVRIYSWNGINTWTKLGQDIDGEAANDSSGWSVSMNAAGDRVAIGAIYNDGSGRTDAGSVRIYDLLV